jgi:hypothetical protein
MGYGAQDIYTRWSLRSLGLWKALEARTASRVFHQTGVLWISRGPDPLTTATLAALERWGVAHEHLSGAALEARWPQIACGARGWAIFEPESGVLHGPPRRRPRRPRSGSRGHPLRHHRGRCATRRTRRIEAVATRSGEMIAGSTFVFACGPWLPALFPDLLDGRIVATRQRCSTSARRPAIPVRAAGAAGWIDFGEEMCGVPDIEARGFKIALDRHGPPLDPDTGDRLAGRTLPRSAPISPALPALRDAPLIAAEVCRARTAATAIS